MTTNLEYDQMMMRKYEHDDETYFDYISKLEGLWDGPTDLIFNFNVFVGSVNMARLLAYYEMYKQVVDISGDIADVGTYRGASLMSFAKLIKIFEPYSQTRAHGFDWFKGMAPGDDDAAENKGKYVPSKEILQRLVSLQGLDGFVELHDMDLTSADLPAFLAERPWLRFKLIFLDCGIADVMQATLEHMYPRLVPGGILMLDHFNNAMSPQESAIVQSFTGEAVVRQIPFSRGPSAYIIKPGA